MLCMVRRIELHCIWPHKKVVDKKKILHQLPIIEYFSILGRENIANVLVKNGANVNSVDSLLRSPLHVAARNGN